MLSNLVRLMRPKHYLKNGLIFVPLVFSGQLLSAQKFTNVFMSAIIFSAVASIVYIVNDIKDCNRDRLHPTKRFRPIASGAISKDQAILLCAVVFLLSLILGILTRLPIVGWMLLGGYLAMNLGYSFGLKNIPLLDVAILALGFVVRVIYGAHVIDIEVSRWLYLTVLMGAFYVSLGKRRNEVASLGHKTRKVNQYYTLNFLDKNMYVCLALTLVFYSLWATDPARDTTSLFWTIPLIILLFMAYSLSIERSDSSGDPIEILTGNKTLTIFALVYIGLTTYLLYA